MKIFLIGFMYSGKTTIGKKLAKSLGYDFVDTDELFEQTYHFTIQHFLENFSEELFRRFEHEILLKVLDMNNIIVSTGGGMPCFFDNMDIINNSGVSVYIKMSPNSILKRHQDSKHKRPLLQNKTDEEVYEFIKEKLIIREEFYNKSRIIIKGESFDLNLLKEQLENF